MPCESIQLESSSSRHRWFLSNFFLVVKVKTKNAARTTYLGSRLGQREKVEQHADGRCRRRRAAPGVGLDKAAGRGERLGRPWQQEEQEQQGKEKEEGQRWVGLMCGVVACGYCWVCILCQASRGRSTQPSAPARMMPIICLQQPCFVRSQHPFHLPWTGLLWPWLLASFIDSCCDAVKGGRGQQDTHAVDSSSSLRALIEESKSSGLLGVCGWDVWLDRFS